MEVKTSALAKNISVLENQIDKEQNKAGALKKRAKASTGEDGQKALLEKLEAKVRGVYEKCGFNAESKPSTLTMLTDLEAKLEELLTQMEQMPEDFVVKAEKQKENERRERYRNARLKEGCGPKRPQGDRWRSGEGKGRGRWEMRMEGMKELETERR